MGTVHVFISLLLSNTNPASAYSFSRKPSPCYLLLILAVFVAGTDAIPGYMLSAAGTSRAGLREVHALVLAMVQVLRTHNPDAWRSLTVNHMSPLTMLS